jgi:hypothetical protein
MVTQRLKGSKQKHNIIILYEPVRLKAWRQKRCDVARKF